LDLQATGMSRTAWIALSVIVVVLVIVAIGLAAFLGGDETSTPNSAAPPPLETGVFELPLSDDPSVLTLGGHARDLLVGIAARQGGPVEVVALRGESPVPAGELRITVGGSRVAANPCGRGCSRVSAPVLTGRDRTLAVRAGAQAVSFDLPAQLPADGGAIFDRALRTMDSLRTYRFTERLSSGRGRVISRIDVQAPDRLQLRTRGFRSVIIGNTRWDRRGGRWEQSSFPGLDVRDVLMWHEAMNPRVVRRLDGGRQELTAFGRKPVPAWFRLEVEPSGRVTEAEMTAVSHFMLHRYSDFDQGVTIKAPR
jgi:hypothetical protein